MSDIIKALMADATADADELCMWFSIEMGAVLIPKLEEAGIALADIPDCFEGYAKWMRENLEMFE